MTSIDLRDQAFLVLRDRVSTCVANYKQLEITALWAQCNALQTMLKKSREEVNTVGRGQTANLSKLDDASEVIGSCLDRRIRLLVEAIHAVSELEAP